MCKLGPVRTVRVTEAFPRSYVTLEAAYEPQPNPSSPALTPAEVRQEFRVPAEQEDQLRTHLSNHALLPCQATELSDETCSPGRVQIAIPAFTPTATAAPKPTGPQNCQLLDTQGVSRSKPLKPEQIPGLQLPGEVLFDTGSAVLGSALQAKLQEVARTLASHPEVQCVALTGHVAAGESSLLADQRSRAVQKALIQYGVDSTRIVAFGGAVPLYGEQQAERTADPKDQNVRFSVLLYKQPGSY